MKMARAQLAEAWPNKNATGREDDVIEIDATDLSYKSLERPPPGFDESRRKEGCAQERVWPEIHRHQALLSRTPQNGD